MEHFLERLAKALLEQHGSELDHVAVVLPGRRAGVHLRRYLARLSGGPIWSPDLFDPGSFLSRVSGLRQGEDLEMLFMLHDAQRANEGVTAEPLTDLLLWGHVALRDMSEIDAHLLDPELVYKDLHAYEEIENWSFLDRDRSSPSQHRAVHQWGRTRALHRSMSKLMLERGVGTSGFIARQAWTFAKDPVWTCPWKKVWFAGLNAMEPAMLSVVQNLTKVGTARIAWDADRYYVNDPAQEAGHFLRNAIAALGPGTLPLGDRLSTAERSIELVATPNNYSQVQYAAQWLAGLSDEERADTVVVLADEDLLLPLLGALSPKSVPLNVTMGVPLTALPIHGFVEALLDAHINFSENGFLFADLERLLTHPFSKPNGSSEAWVETLRSIGSDRIGPEELQRVRSNASLDPSGAFVQALRRIEKPRELAQRIQSLIAWSASLHQQDKLALEQLFQLARNERALQQAVTRYSKDDIDVKTYRIVRERVLRNARLTLFGEPLAGLQIMGLLETRAIDHQRVLILGANDETLSNTGSQSWIPFDIRRHHGLPSRSHTEAISAYHLHRLLHCARTVGLVYTSGGDGSGEPTRFAAQWKKELQPRSKTRIEHRSVQAPTRSRNEPTIMVDKGQAVQERIAAIAGKGFSPSVLGTWLRCPLDFYFRHVLGIADPDGNDGKLGSDVLGSVVHKVLEKVFANFLHERIRPEWLEGSTNGVLDLLRTELAREIPLARSSEGHTRLSVEMAAKAISNYLFNEATRCRTEETVPIKMEASLTGTLSNGTRLRGTCDRIELRNGVLHVLDLKTGGARPEGVGMKGLEREHLRAHHSHALQLLIYAYLVFQSDPSIKELKAGIVPLRKSSNTDGLWLSIAGSKTIQREMLPGMENLFEQVIGELKDPAIPFTHNQESRWCKTCVS